MQVGEAPPVICLSAFVSSFSSGICDSIYFFCICAIISLCINREKMAGQVSVAGNIERFFDGGGLRSHNSCTCKKLIII
jgi:hypothetical protein